MPASSITGKGVTSSAEEKRDNIREEQLLSDLPRDTPVYKYSSTADMLRVISHETQRFGGGGGGVGPEHQTSGGQFIVFMNVPVTEVEGLWGPGEERRDYPLAQLRIDYRKHQQALVVKMYCTQQDVASGTIKDIIFHKLDAMRDGTSKQLRAHGSATVASDNRIKRPDEALAPAVEGDGTPGRPAWPTVVVEVGFLESSAKLDDDARWWLRESNGRVQVVITVGIKRTTQRNRQVHLKKWEMSRYSLGAHMGPHRGPLETFTGLLHSTDEQEYGAVSVDPEQMVIPFKQLFRREPVQGEHDVVLTSDDLAGLADGIWMMTNTPS